MLVLIKMAVCGVSFSPTIVFSDKPICIRENMHVQMYGHVGITIALKYPNSCALKVVSEEQIVVVSDGTMSRGLVKYLKSK